MKKLITLLLTVFVLLTMAGCSGDGSSSANKKSQVLKSDDLSKYVTEIELTLDNYTEYLEWKEYHFEDKDAFGDVTGTHDIMVLSTKKGYGVSQNDERSIAVGLSFEGTRTENNYETGMTYIDNTGFDSIEYINPFNLTDNCQYLPCYTLHYEGTEFTSDFVWDKKDVTKIKGSVFEVNIPDECYNTLENDLLDYSKDELGRYVVVKDAYNNNVAIFENGYTAYNFKSVDSITQDDFNRITTFESFIVFVLGY